MVHKRPFWIPVPNHPDEVLVVENACQTLSASTNETSTQTTEIWTAIDATSGIIFLSNHINFLNENLAAKDLLFIS